MELAVPGPFGSRLRIDMPVPRLPRWLGTPNLRSSNSVYPRVDLDIPITLVTFNVSGGALTGVANIDNGLIPSFSTRFGSLFKEFAIVGARFELRIISQ